ncbi:MAG TPA: LysR substrate-binding domain-containing protein [Polyangia bacterium]|nr:LysR substrate-binding domain-containing protein [Polyangia bacterium]
MLALMELRHLRYFVAVAEEESVTRAATRLHVSQPPLSRQIRSLERELGADLFDRSPNRLRLTTAGETFLAEARAVLQRAEDAVELLKAVALGKQGKVRVGHAPAAIEVLRRALPSFSRTHPHVIVDLREMTSQGMLRGLRDRELDVALTVAISPHDFEGLAFENLAAYPICLAMNRKHRFARRRVVPLRDVAGEPIVGRSRKEYPEAHAGVLKILAPYTRSPKLVEEYDSFASLIAAVEAGRGVAFVVQIMSRVPGKRLVLRPLEPTPPRVPVVMAYRTEGVSATAAAFLAATRAARLKRPRAAHPILTA